MASSGDRRHVPVAFNLALLLLGSGCGGTGYVRSIGNDFFAPEVFHVAAAGDRIEARYTRQDLRTSKLRIKGHDVGENVLGSAWAFESVDVVGAGTPQRQTILRSEKGEGGESRTLDAFKVGAENPGAVAAAGGYRVTSFLRDCFANDCADLDMERSGPGAVFVEHGPARAKLDVQAVKVAIAAHGDGAIVAALGWRAIDLFEIGADLGVTARHKLDHTGDGETEARFHGDEAGPRGRGIVLTRTSDRIVLAFAQSADDITVMTGPSLTELTRRDKGFGAGRPLAIWSSGEKIKVASHHERFDDKFLFVSDGGETPVKIPVPARLDCLDMGFSADGTPFVLELKSGAPPRLVEVGSARAVILGKAADDYDREHCQLARDGDRFIAAWVERGEDPEQIPTNHLHVVAVAAGVAKPLAAPIDLTPGRLLEP